MTAITINLFVEEQLAQEAAARNPFKLALAVGVSLFSAAVILGAAIGHRASQQKNEADTLQAKWDKLQSTQSGGSRSDTKSYKGLVDEIRSINEARPVFAPQLALIKDVVPDTVQLSQIGFSYVTEEITTPVVAAEGESDKAAARRAKPKTIEHMVLVLTGLATCARPEIEVDDFIKTLQAHPALSKVVQQIRLRSITRMTGPADGSGLSLPTVAFSIDCQYRERS